MADLVIAAAGVAFVQGDITRDAVAGEAFVAGEMVYYRATDGKWLKAQDDGTAIEAGQDGIGMALGTADAANARVSIARPGAIVAVGAGVAGTVYCLSGTAGKLAPTTDNATGNRVTIAALGIGTSRLQLCWVYNSAAVVP